MEYKVEDMAEMPGANKLPIGAKVESFTREEVVDVRELLAILDGGKWWIVSAIGLALSVAFLYVTFSPPIYRADALVQVEEERSALRGLADLTDVFPSESAIGAEIEIIRSRAVLGEVVKELGLTIVLRSSQPPMQERVLAAFPMQRQGKQELENDSKKEGAVSIRRFFVSEGKRRIELRLALSGGGRVSIFYQGNPVAVGNVGETIEFSLPNGGEQIYMNVRSAGAGAGAGAGTGVNEQYDLIYIPPLMAIENLKEILSVSEVGRDTGVLRLALEGEKPDHIENILTSITNNYLKQNTERRSAEAQQSLTFLNEQLPNVRSELERAETRLATFRENNRTIDLTIETEGVLQKMVGLDQRLSELELKRSDLLRNYTPDHPLIQTLNDQRGKLIKEKNDLEAESSNLPDVQQELLRFTREVEVSTQLYTYMLNKVQELRVVEAGTVGNVRVLDYAAAALRPVKPRKALVLALAFIFGCMAGLSVIILRKIFQSGIVDPGMVEGLLNVPVYSVLPFSNDVKRVRDDLGGLVTRNAPKSIIAESFRSLRTSIHFAVAGKDQGVVICIAGPTPNVGKTFVATNLAATLASAGHKVLFVDGDMRRGDAASAFGVKQRPGLSELLSGHEEHANAIQDSISVQNLNVVARGKSPPNPAELLLGSKIEELVAAWRDLYDYVILDSPPVLAVTDPVVLARLSDALFIIGRAGGTTEQELVESKNRFQYAGVHVKGVIINGMTEKLAPTGKYGYRYGYYSYSSQND